MERQMWFFWLPTYNFICFVHLLSELKGRFIAAGSFVRCLTLGKTLEVNCLFASYIHPVNQRTRCHRCDCPIYWDESTQQEHFSLLLSLSQHPVLYFAQIAFRSKCWLSFTYFSSSFAARRASTVANVVEPPKHIVQIDLTKLKVRINKSYDNSSSP